MINLSPSDGYCMASNTAEGELARRGAAGNRYDFDHGCGVAAL
jgi:hypothetical protein